MLCWIVGLFQSNHRLQKPALPIPDLPQFSRALCLDRYADLRFSSLCLVKSEAPACPKCTVLRFPSLSCMETLYFFPAFLDLRSCIFIGLVLTMKKLRSSADLRPVVTSRLARAGSTTIDRARTRWRHDDFEISRETWDNCPVSRYSG